MDRPFLAKDEIHGNRCWFIVKLNVPHEATDEIRDIVITSCKKNNLNGYKQNGIIKFKVKINVNSLPTKLL